MPAAKLPDRNEQNTNNHPRALDRLQIADWSGNAPVLKLFIIVEGMCSVTEELCFALIP